MAKKNSRKRKPFVFPVIDMTRYFRDGQKPDYKKWEVLSNFINERGKILGRTRTNLDAKTQRRLTREIKRARHLALLPFAVKPM